MLGTYNNKKDIIWLLFVMLFSYSFFYISTSGGTCSGIDRVGFAGIHTLLFFFVYYAVCIYAFHLERLKGNRHKNKISLSNLMVVFLSISFPILMMGIINSECKFNLSFASALTITPLLLLIIIDRSGLIKKELLRILRPELIKWEGIYFSITRQQALVISTLK